MHRVQCGRLPSHLWCLDRQGRQASDERLTIGFGDGDGDDVSRFIMLLLPVSVVTL
jgi:hypothetical protein